MRDIDKLLYKPLDLSIPTKARYRVRLETTIFNICVYRVSQIFLTMAPITWYVCCILDTGYIEVRNGYITAIQFGNEYYTLKERLNDTRN